jgi:hypothetical protein
MVPISIGEKTGYIILSNSSSYSGLNIDMHANIITKVVSSTSSTNNDVGLGEFFLNAYSEKYKNRIILSQALKGTGTNTSLISTCLITQNNIKNNIKFIHTNSNINNTINTTRKILFINNQDIDDNSYNYLFDTIDESVPTLTSFYHLNYYFNDTSNNQNRDYFNIKIKDFIYKDYLNTINSNVDFNSTTFKITEFLSTPIFSNVDSNLINYNSFDFSSLFIDTNSSPTTLLDISINTFNSTNYYSLYNNIYIYNKLTLDFTNINSYTFSLYSSPNSNSMLNLYNNNTSGTNYYNTFTTFMIKTNNFNIINNIKANSKIIFNKNDIYLQNVKVIDNASNFYATNRAISANVFNANTIFLSLGKQISGITQYDLYNNTHVISKNKSVFDISKIIFKKNINSSLITPTNINYNTLVPSASNLYLLDFTFNYNSNNNNNINNIMNYNNILFNHIEYKNKKIFDFNISKIIDFSKNNNTYINNNYINNIINLLTINKNTFKDVTIATINNTTFNNALRFKVKNISYDKAIYTFNNVTDVATDLYTSTIEYNVRYNYGKTFPIKFELDILLDNLTIGLLNNYYPFNNRYANLYYSKVNFYSLQVVNIFTTTQGSDFENVDCIFIYHDPATETDPSFLYPYNNIEIRKDSTIDSLEKAIVILPGARTSTTNSTFIPARNGSNLSRKMIQGLIGLNNIPKLLSIVPYDENVIVGRGFVNQYQISDTCSDDDARVKTKKNSIKYYAEKDNRTNSATSLINENFANVVRSSARSRLSQNCINNLEQNYQELQNASQNTPIVTPFRMFIRK